MKYNLYIYFTTLLLMFTSCNDDFLEKQIGTELSQEQVFKSYDFTNRFLAGTYIYLPDGFNRIDGAMLESASDDAEHTWEGSSIQRFNNGSWSPYSNPDDQWTKFYTGIRRVNLF